MWHHIVERCQDKASRSGLATKLINSTGNIISVSKEIHEKISAFYSSVPKDKSFVNTGGMVFRDWLNGKSFQQQYEWGLKVLRYFGVKV